MYGAGFLVGGLSMKGARKSKPVCFMLNLLGILLFVYVLLILICSLFHYSLFFSMHYVPIICSFVWRYNTFCGYPPEVVRKMPKKDLAEEVAWYNHFFCSMIFFMSTHISHCCMIKSADIDFPLVHFQVWRLQAALGEQSEITKCTKQEYERLQNVWPLLVSALSFHLKYAASAFSSFFHLKYIGTVCPLTSELFRFKLSTLKDLRRCNLDSNYTILGGLLTL